MGTWRAVSSLEMPDRARLVRIRFRAARKIFTYTPDIRQRGR